MESGTTGVVCKKYHKRFIGIEKNNIELNINGELVALNIDKTRRYFGGVTELFRKLGMLTSDNTYINKTSKWKIADNVIIVEIN